MRKAMDITRLGIEAMMRTAKPNQKEYEIEAAYDYTLMVNGAREKAFRTIAAGGKRGTILHYVENKLVYNIVLEGQRRVIDAIRPGVQFSSLNELLKEYYFTALKEIGLVETREDVAKYYYHGVSHYLGAETHDIGRYGDRVLEPGMVLTVEPGLYIEEWEIGIRIEDDVLVTAEGNEVMTAAMLKTVDEIEAFMAKE